MDVQPALRAVEVSDREPVPRLPLEGLVFECDVGAAGVHSDGKQTTGRNQILGLPDVMVRLRAVAVLAVDTIAHGQAVRECRIGLMAGRAGNRAVAGERLIVEKFFAEADAFNDKRVVAREI